MSRGKATTLAEDLPRWAIPPGAFADAGADLPAVIRRTFGRTAPLLLDIGFGSGAATRALAVEHPGHDVLGIEVHRAGIALLVQRLSADGPTNIRIADIDALHVLARLEPRSVAGIRVLFPDPWPKRRHHERRLVDAAFVARSAALLVPGGTLHVATDWDDYAAQVRGLLDADPHLAPVADGRAPWRSPRPDRPVTTYEARGLADGRTVTDLVARRIDPSAVTPA